MNSTHLLLARSASGMRRRRFFTRIVGSITLLSISGCAGLLPTEDGNSPDYPGGTLVVENAGESALDISVGVVEEQYSASLDTTVSAGDTDVRREFVTASEGDVVTLSAVLGGDGDPTTFEFLPAGGDGDAPPEVAALTIQNAVEESASWTALQGS